MSLKFERNIGTLDMWLRIGISAVLLYASVSPARLIEDDFAADILAVLAVINLFAALTRFCPLYTLADINTYHAQ